MPDQRHIKSESWAWFRAELDRRLGPDQAAALWAELTRRRRMEYDAKRRKTARRELIYHEALLAERRTQGRATARIERTIARLRSLLDGGQDGTA